MRFYDFIIECITFYFKFSVFMTVYAPLHSQRRILINLLHCINWPMASETYRFIRLQSFFFSDCLFTYYNVLRVIEVSKVRKVVDTHPLNWLLFGLIISH